MINSRAACERKVRHGDAYGALQAAASTLKSKNPSWSIDKARKKAARLPVYACEFCGGWHWSSHRDAPSSSLPRSASCRELFLAARSLLPGDYLVDYESVVACTDRIGSAVQVLMKGADYQLLVTWQAVVFRVQRRTAP